MNRLFPQSLEKHWKDPKGLIQVFTGPRQVGKTTAVLSLMEKQSSVYANADLPMPPTTEFIVTHWHKARKLSSAEKTLVLDEVQKIPRWSETVKGLWDEDQRHGKTMRVCLLGSSSILIEKGLSESLTGRFEANYFPHWTFAECKACFDASIEDYAMIGGYPKVYDFRDDPERLNAYVQDSILEPTLGRDVLSLHSVDKPALLRQLFWYVSRLPAHLVSFEKILSHLQGRGNSATLVHYAELLQQAFLLSPLAKFSPRSHRTKRSIPKWILPNPALVDESVKKEGLQGFSFENLIGAHLLNIFFGKKRYEVQYWREESREIDFVLTEKNVPWLALEVKSGRPKNLPTAKEMAAQGLDCPLLIITPQNAEAFLSCTSYEEISKLGKSGS